MNGGPSGFHNAPFTRTFITASAILTVLLGVQGRSSRLGLSYEEIFQKLHIWRLIASVFAFSSTPELIFGSCLLYYFRVFERQIGSNKHSIFILFSILVSSLFEILALAYLQEPSLSRLASGPYGLIFASFIPFYFDIPVTSRFRICGVSLSDKSFTYLAGLQLLFSSWKRSLVPGLCGVFAGSLYRLNLLGIHKVKFPENLTSFFSRLSWSSFAISRPRNTPTHVARETENNHPSARTPIFEPSEAFVAQLVSMGFDGSSARQALVHARNDINIATNILLEAQAR
ncbi:hypothetical protein AXF42_Ash010635 [Apostasia shenzhenica]|uniref:UBA domain-containing protein n=1 Tax=Apostasia shenzhenica TaxID=1088818 RepID=A0A2I0A6N8_9ASPA|nr:hypothetical protein AXF42_Ash010635 [Apostasia shenzhenica]